MLTEVSLKLKPQDPPDFPVGLTMSSIFTACPDLHIILSKWLTCLGLC